MWDDMWDNNYRSNRSGGTIIGVIITLIILALIYSPYIMRAFDKADNHREVTGTVTKMEVKKAGRFRYNEEKYLVYTKDENDKVQVYEITDSVIEKRYDSSDLYGEIEVGKTYRFDVAGKRNERRSWYPNIYSAEEIEI